LGCPRVISSLKIADKGNAIQNKTVQENLTAVKLQNGGLSDKDLFRPFFTCRL
jgi:hypothetical protein